MAKSMMQLVVDVGATMAGPTQLPPPSLSATPHVSLSATAEAGKSKYDLARTFVMSYATHKMIEGRTTFEWGVLLCGSDATRNNLNEDPNVGGYENIEVAVNMGRPEIESLELLDTKFSGASSQQQSSLTDGVIVASDILIKTREKNKYTRIMVVITDAESEISSDDMETWEGHILPGMTTGDLEAKKNIYLNVIVLGSAINNPAASFTKRENAKMLQHAARSTGGDYIEATSVSDCFWLLSCGPGLGTTPSKSKIVMELAPSLKVPCQYWALIMKKGLPSLKKKRKIEQLPEEGEGEGGGGEDERQVRVELGEVKRDSRTVHPHDMDLDLTIDDKIKGIKYGAQYVPVTHADEHEMKLTGEAGIFVIATVPSAQVPRHHFMDSTMLLQGHDKVEAAQSCISVFATALRNNNMVAIARLVKSDNKVPMLICLSPPQEDNGTLVLHRVPCKDDTRVYSFPRMPKLSNVEGFAAMGRFIDAMTYPPSSSASVGIPAQILTPYNPAHYNMVLDLMRKILGLEPSAIDFVSRFPSASILPNPREAQRALSELKTLFPLIKSDANAGAKKKKVFFSDLLFDSGDGAGGGATAADSEAAARLRVPVLTAGSTSPLEDLEAVMSHAQSTPESRKAALQVLCGIITNFVTVGSSASYYTKATECLAALRAAALNELPRLTHFYNTFLSDDVLPLVNSSRHAAFKDCIVASAITVISDAEDVASAFTVQQAADFFAEPMPDTSVGGGEGNVTTQKAIINDSLFDDLA